MNRSSEVQNLTAVRKKKGIILRPAVGRQDCSPPVTRNHLRREAIKWSSSSAPSARATTHQSLSETLNNKSGSRLGKPSQGQASSSNQNRANRIPHGPLHSFFQWVHAAAVVATPPRGAGSCRRVLPCACSCLSSRRAKAGSCWSRKRKAAR